MPDSREKLEWKYGAMLVGDAAGIAGLALGEFTEVGLLIAIGGIGGGLAIAALPMTVIGLAIAVLGDESSLQTAGQIAEALGFVSAGVLALVPVNAVFSQLSPKDDPLLFAKTFGPVIDAATGILGSKSLEELTLPLITFDANEYFWLEDYNKLLNYYYAPAPQGSYLPGGGALMPGGGTTPAGSPQPGATQSAAPAGTMGGGWNNLPGQGDLGFEFPIGSYDDPSSANSSYGGPVFTITYGAGQPGNAGEPATGETGTNAPPFDDAPVFDDAPFDNAPFDNAPFDNAPFDNAPFDNAPFDNAPFDNAPFDNAPFFDAPLP
jgi:hypothetical protein